MKQFFIVILILFGQNIFAQFESTLDNLSLKGQLINDLEIYQLKGNVRSLTKYYYDAKIVNEEIIKTKKDFKYDYSKKNRREYYAKTFHFDEHGNIYKISYMQDTTDLKKVSFETVVVLEYSEDNILLKRDKLSYSYDDQGRIIKYGKNKITYNEGGYIESTGKSDFAYKKGKAILNTKGEVLSVDLIVSITGENENKKTYTYNGIGRITDIHKYSQGNVNHDSWTYDKDGLLSKEILGSSLISSGSEYFYKNISVDDNNNWTERSESTLDYQKNIKPREIIVREIEYYK